MIITWIRLQPFGALSNQEFSFQSGLNVVLGPNEAGKSTVFNAIQKTLLTPTALTKKAREQEIQRYLPIGGGDTIKVELHFTHNGDAYALKKTWGATQGVSLILPDGQMITDDLAVQERLQAYLPAKHGTIRSVLMTYQSGLEKTLSDLERDKETVHTLGDMLTRAVLETDGISVEHFRAKLQELYDDYFSRWDRQAGYPVKGKGIEDPWKKGVGQILGAFYEKEEIRARLENIRNYERELDELNRALADVSKRLAEHNAYHQANWQIVDSIRNRKGIEAEAENICRTVEDLQEHNGRWPVLEKELEKIQSDLPVLKKNEQLLLAEYAEAEDAEKGKALREKYERVKVRKTEVQEMAARLAQLKQLPLKELEEIKSSAAAVDRLRAALTAGKLKAIFRSKKDIVVTIEKGLEKAGRVKLDKDKRYGLTADGRIRIGHEDWEIDVRSGDGNFEEMKHNFDQEAARYQNLLAKHEVKTLEEAIAVSAEFETRLADVKHAEKNVETELQGQMWEDLESKIKGAGGQKSVRPMPEITADLVRVQMNIKNKEKEATDIQKTLDGYVAKYQNRDHLLKKLLFEAMQKEVEIKQRLEALLPIPTAVVDVDAYLKQYDENLSAIVREEEEQRALQVRQAEHLGNAPGESSEELEPLLKESTRNYETVLKKGEAIERIRSLSGKLMSSIDGDLYQELEKELEHAAAVMTQNKHAKVKMDQCMPVGFIRSDGGVLGYDLLSFGTKDMLGLALRLAMAKHFLDGSDGFLAMDDPLVNMDPTRQERAAELIRNYASNKQVIVFTCHPSHAEMLGGHRIELL